MALEFEGSLIKVLPEVSGQGKNGAWVKQDFVLETEEQYPKKACFTAWGDKSADLKTFSLGDKLKVTFSVESREYNERWYTDLRAYRIDLASDAPSQSAGSSPVASSRPSAPSKPAAPAADLPSFSEDDQDLPF
ncbi:MULTISPECIES: DUF3127 domain-containing protein [unclassified Arcicella]|uniref:DUF3127 domain-containing protein n=1 Tax=unclassified Arcicella TaxID=2644986 RepID=UPI002865A0AB|nr:MULTISPECIES: DUF3127 domain-containing protein [unclassified Arcicella]MDR6561794.1 hypothetical protein [Arcicella sp. BE51]MDR6813940.1 hypothetical protein [Arcicella sp. BE140]MDR6825353.1 hypothetical protein [Arcicella sp. BE139]